MIVRKWVAVAALAAATGVGAIVGTTMLGTASAAGVSTTTLPGAATPTAPAAGHSNEDPAHEAGESPEREAAEANGTATYGPPGGAAGESSTAPRTEASSGS